MIPDKPSPQLRTLDTTSPKFHEQLSDFLRGGECQDTFPRLQSEDLALLVEHLDSVLVGLPNHTSSLFRESLQSLTKICGEKEVLPKSCTLLESRLGCVYEGTLDGSKVRVRRVRSYPGADPRKVKEVFHQVAVISKHLNHPNIVPLLGTTIQPLELISDWMSGGDLLGYIARHPDTNRLSLLSDVAEGLNHLHFCNVIHGDLRGSCILVDGTGRARIADFGLAIITQDLDQIRSASAGLGRSAQWVAPEILGNRGTYSKEADVFSFAGITVEVFTGTAPFNEKTPRAAVLAIMGGDRPSRPTHPDLTDSLWALVQRCWNREARLRPDALQISCAFGTPAWKRLIDCTLSPEDRISLLTRIFSDRDEVEVVRCLDGADAQSFVDAIDEILDKLAPSLRRKCLSTLCRICGRQAILPRSMQVPLCYDQTDAPLYHGGYSEVWKGEYQAREVAVKVLKVYQTSDFDKITRRFCKEVLTWKALCHPNVLPLFGVTMRNYRFAMASEWMVNGNINQFVKAHRDADRLELLTDVARGLIYIHGEGVIHGDLKGANILIDVHGHACLADFGLVAIVSDSTTSITSTNAGTTRWMSPELLYPGHFNLKDGRPTKESDCYALGMVIYEVLSGQAPFAPYMDFIVLRKVIEGERPGRPSGAEGAWFTDDLWGMLEQCWSTKPKDRPTTKVILEHLEHDLHTRKPLSLGAGDDVVSDDDSNSTVNYYTAQATLQEPAREHSGQPPEILQPLPTGRDKDGENLIVAGAYIHTPITPPSHYELTNAVIPIPLLEYVVGNISVT